MFGQSRYVTINQFRSSFTNEEIAFLDRKIRGDAVPFFDKVVPYLSLTNIITAQFVLNQFLDKLDNKKFKNYIVECMKKHHYNNTDIEVFDSTLSKPLVKDVTSADYDFISSHYDYQVSKRMLDAMHLMSTIYYTIHPLKKTNELHCKK